MFGFSFGKKKSSSSTNSTLTKDEQTLQQQESVKGSTSQTSSTGSSQTQQTGSSQTTGSGSTTQTGTQTQAGKTTQFSSGILQGLESQVANLLGQNPLTGAVNMSMDRLDDFDSGAFVDQSVAAATSRERATLDELIGGLSDNIGSAVGNNSMATLLASRASGDAAARIEGVRAQATETAQGIQRANMESRVGAAGTQANFLQNLLGALKGGVSESTGLATSTEAGTSQTQQGTTTNQQSATQEQQTQTTQLLEILKQVLAGNTATTATENTTQKGKTSGGGISLSI